MQKIKNFNLEKIADPVFPNKLRYKFRQGKITVWSAIFDDTTPKEELKNILLEFEHRVNEEKRFWNI
jgi:hypothetical protein